MRRTAIVTLLISAALAAALGLAACGGATTAAPSSGEAQTFDPNKQYDLTMWSGFTGRELDVLDVDHRQLRAAEPERLRRQRRQRQRRQDRRRAARGATRPT